jgi:hypothetical protein
VRGGPEDDRGPIKPQAAELRCVPRARQPRRRPEKGGAPLGQGTALSVTS